MQGYLYPGFREKLSVELSQTRLVVGQSMGSIYHSGVCRSYWYVLFLRENEKTKPSKPRGREIVCIAESVQQLHVSKMNVKAQPVIVPSTNSLLVVPCPSSSEVDFIPCQQMFSMNKNCRYLSRGIIERLQHLIPKCANHA